MSLSTVNHAVGFVLNLLNLRKTTVPILPTVSQKPSFSPTAIENPFVRATPESQGVSSAHIARFIEQLRDDPTLNLHSLLLLRRGVVVAEVAFGEQDMLLPKMTFSACKSITSLAIGMLIDEKKLSLDTRVVDLFPDKTTAVTRLKYKDLTVRHLLSMTSGISFNEAECMMDSDWIRACFNSTPSAKVGQTFAYNSLNSYLLSAIVTRVSQTTLTEYLRPRLWEPLGIAQYFWETCPEGVEKGGWGLYLKTEDMAKIGQLVLNGGTWNGQRLVSQEYLRQACSFKKETPINYGDFNYGYHLWVGREANTWLFNGMLGQNVLAFLNTDILLVNQAGNDEMFQQSRYFRVAQEYFGGDFADFLPENREDEKKLKSVIESCKSQTKKEKPIPWWRRSSKNESMLPRDCHDLNGEVLSAVSPQAASIGLLPAVLQSVQNKYATGLLSLRFEVSDNRFMMEYCERDETYRFEIGFGAHVVTELCFSEEPYRVATKGRFAKNEYDETVLLIEMAFLETPCTRTLKIVWHKNGIKLYQGERPGIPFLLTLLSDVKQRLDAKPLIGAAVGKLDEDYLLYKINGIFSPEISLGKSKDHETLI